MIDDWWWRHYEANRALNCALITWNTNRHIAAKEPLKYLEEQAQRGQLGLPELKSRLASHSIPYDELAVGGYDQFADDDRADRVREDYDRFLTARAELLLPTITALCAGQAV